MNEAVAVGGLIVVVCTVIGLILQVRKQVADQRAAESAAAAALRKRTLAEGYALVRPYLDRVEDLLNSIIGGSPTVDRQINRAISILTDAREGSPDADGD